MAVGTEAHLDHQLEVLQGISHAFGSASDFGEVAASASRWVRAAVGSEEAAVRIVLPDGMGRLRVASTDREVSDGGRKRSARRRAAFEARTPLRLDLEGPEGKSLAILPLVCRGETVGVLEVVACRNAIEERWDTLAAVASQVAIALWNLRHQATLRREVETLGEAVSLGRDLVRVQSPEAAVREAVRFLFERFQTPVVAWLPGEDPEQMVLAEVRGLGSRKRKELRAAMGSLPRWGSLSDGKRIGVTTRYASILGVDQVEAAGSTNVLLLAGESTPSLRTSLDFVGSLLDGVLRHLSTAALVDRRNEELDLGIAWTAHEFRGPLMGVKAVLEFLLRENEAPPANQAMIGRAVRELDQLSGLVDGLLRWAVGAGSLRRRPADLLQMVQEAVESCSMETGEERVSVSSPDQHVTVLADPKHFRGAIANLVRNALAYSPSDRAVEVTIGADNGWATVSVRDHGPGIPAAERETIFDPFIRGGASSPRNGKSLGLFITRRVVEAHEGTIWLESNGSGASFHIKLPAQD